VKSKKWFALAGDTKGKAILQTIVTVCFPSKICCVAATEDGSFYVFRITNGALMIAKLIVKAHKGPIFDVWCNESLVLSVGKDQKLNRWRFSIKLGTIDFTYLKTTDLADSLGGASIKSVSYREPGITYEGLPPAVIVGASNNTVYEINEITNQISVVVLGHCGGHSATLLNQSLSLHPSDPSLMLSGGANGHLVLWDLELRKSVEHKLMDAPIVAVEFSNKGDSFAIGLVSGRILIHNGAGIQKQMIEPEKQRTSAARSIKFSPNDQFLACGLDCNWIDVYDVAGEQCKLVATLKGHAAPVTEIDWYVTKSCEVLRSERICILYFDILKILQGKGERVPAKCEFIAGASLLGLSCKSANSEYR
jgi:WD40 repeat protein